MSSASIGKACTTAGPSSNQPGICESVPCGDGGAAASDAGTCVRCEIDGTAGACGGGRSHGTAASFAPTVGGCCSVAGKAAWGSGAGVVLGTFAFALALVRRRRSASR